MISPINEVLHINLTKQECNVKSYPELRKYIGGLGVGLHLLKARAGENPIVLSVGPLNGFFPFASKTSVTSMLGKKIGVSYLGGAVSSRIRFCGVDAICIEGASKDPVTLNIFNDQVEFLYDVGEEVIGLPGKRSVLNVSPRGVLLDDYFEPGSGHPFKNFVKKNIKSVVITGTRVLDVKNLDRYAEIYNAILERHEEVLVKREEFPSCVGCPMGCKKSKVGEKDGNVLVHCLVACSYSEPLYSNVNTVFSCLNVLGYDYTHEDIENVPHLVYDLIEDFKK